MTIITVTSTEGRLTANQRREPAETLTDAVLVPDMGQLASQARIGFQVHVVERAGDCIAIGGRLVCDASPSPGAFTPDRVSAIRSSLASKQLE
jgi:hypothetical protein